MFITCVSIAFKIRSSESERERERREGAQALWIASKLMFAVQRDKNMKLLSNRKPDLRHQPSALICFLENHHIKNKCSIKYLHQKLSCALQCVHFYNHLNKFRTQLHYQYQDGTMAFVCATCAGFTTWAFACWLECYTLCKITRSARVRLEYVLKRHLSHLLRFTVLIE